MSVNPLSMSDEDYMKLPPIVGDTPSTVVAEDDETGQQTGQEIEPGQAETGVETGQETGQDLTTIIPEAGAAAPAQGAAEGAGAEGEPPVDDNTDPAAQAAAADTPPTPEELNAYYAEMTAPLKAVGKTLEIRSPAEARRLMQLGANYNKRMQELAPSRKAVAMLEQAGLLGNEENLSLLISASKGDKAALQKLLADQSIDPLDLDTERAGDYTPGAYRVSDEDLRFNEALREVSQTELGLSLVAEIDETWDTASKAKVYQHPETLEQFRQARENGDYAKITAEVDRLRTLGQVSHDMPFFDAYVRVGHYMLQQGLLGSNAGQPEDAAAQTAKLPSAGQPGAQPQVLGHRVAVPRGSNPNGDRAKATATPARSTSAKPQPVNPLSLSDEEYSKQFGNLPV